MNRLDELTLKLADGELTDAERDELTSLLTDDAAIDRHVALLDIEAALRASGPAPTVAGETVAEIKKQSAEDLERSVMRVISAMPVKEADSKTVTRVRNLSWMLLGASMLTACLVLLGVSNGWLGRNAENARPSGDSVEGVAVLIEKSPDVRLVSADGKSQLPVIGRPIPAGKTIATLRDGWAIVQLPDGSRLNLYSNSQLKLEAPTKSGRTLGLLSGSLRADVKPGTAAPPLFIRTPHARVRLAETQVTLSALQEQGTRVDLDHGTAELNRDDRQPVSLVAGSTAFVPNGEQAVVVKARPTALVEPTRETAFKGLRRLSSYLPNGGVFAVTQWQAVFWHPDDRVEAMPMSRLGRRGVRMERLNGASVAIRESGRRKRLLLWDARSRKPAGTVRTKSRYEKAGAVSPVGGWVALIDPRKDGRREFRLVFDKSRRRKPARFKGKQIISAMAASPDGRLLAVGRRRIGHSKGNAVDLIDCEAGERVARLDVKYSHPIALSFSADGDRLAVGLSGRVQVWDVEQRKQAVQIEQPGCPLLHVALSPDGLTLAGAGQGDRLWIWDLPTGEERCVILPGEQSRGMTFKTNGTLIVLTKDGRLTEWKLPSRNEKPPVGAPTAL